MKTKCKIKPFIKQYIILRQITTDNKRHEEAYFSPSCVSGSETLDVSLFRTDVLKTAGSENQWQKRENERLRG